MLALIGFEQLHTSIALLFYGTRAERHTRKCDK